jgi:hypothetical protein
LAALDAAIADEDPAAFMDFLDGLGMSPEKIVDFFMAAGKPTDRVALKNKREAEKALKAVEALKKELADKEASQRYQAAVDAKHGEVRAAKGKFPILSKLPDELVVETAEAVAKTFNEQRRDWGGDVSILLAAVEGQLAEWAKMAGFTKAEAAAAVAEVAPKAASVIEELSPEDEAELEEEEVEKPKKRPPSELTGEGSGKKRGAPAVLNGHRKGLRERMDNVIRKYT